MNDYKLVQIQDKINKLERNRFHDRIKLTLMRRAYMVDFKQPSLLITLKVSTWILGDIFDIMEDRIDDIMVDQSWFFPASRC